MQKVKAIKHAEDSQGMSKLLALAQARDRAWLTDPRRDLSCRSCRMVGCCAKSPSLDAQACNLILVNL